MNLSLINKLNLPIEITNKIYYLSIPESPCKNSILESYNNAVEYKNEIDTIYKNEDYFIFPNKYISDSILIYLSRMLNNEGREHSHHIDPEVALKFILFH